MKGLGIEMRMTDLNLTPRSLLLAAVVLSCVLTGCMVGPKYHPPTTQAPPAYKESPANVPQKSAAPPATTSTDPTLGGLGDWTVAQPQDASLRGKWWEIYGDPELNALEEQLNINNQNIKQFFENFMAARAIVRQAHAQLFPTVSTGPSWSRSRSSSNMPNVTGAAGRAPVNGATSTLIDVPAAVSWEPDLWGKIRNTVRQAQYSAQISAADLENERLTEQASLATFFFQLRGQDALQQILDATVAADQKSLELARAQYETGLSDQIAVVQAQTTLQSAQSLATNLGIARAQYEHAIATLIGKAASDFSIPAKPLLTTPPPIPVGLPSQLLERRPDIAAAERSMAATNAQIGIAYAAYYPSLTLSATGGFESSTLKHLLDWPSRVWSLGAAASETVLDFGLRSGQTAAARASYDASVATYRQTVLTGFQQVEDNLAALGILKNEAQVQDEAVRAARQSLAVSTNQYKAGTINRIALLVVETVALTNEITAITILGSRMSANVLLIEALGGGWNAADLPPVGWEPPI